MTPKFISIILISEYILLSTTYALAEDYRRAVYWIAAGVLTACVTF